MITIPSREATSEVKNEDFKRLLHYLSGLPRCVLSLSIYLAMHCLSSCRLSWFLFYISTY